MAQLSNYKSNNEQQQTTYEYVRVDKADILNAPTCFVNAVKRSGDFGEYWQISVIMYGTWTPEGDLNESQKVNFLLPSSESRDKLLTAMNERNCYIHNVMLVQKEFIPKGKKSAISMYQFVAATSGTDCPCSFLRTIDEQPEPGITFVQFEALQHGIHLDTPFCLKYVEMNSEQTHWVLSTILSVDADKIYTENTIILKRTEGRDRLFESIIKEGEFPVHGCMFVRKTFTPKGQTDQVAYYDLISPEIEVCPCGEHLAGPMQLDLDEHPW